MDIKHKLGSNMEILLDQNDLFLIESQGWCMDRNGLVGRQTKTWVRIDRMIEKPIALIDGASDVYVDIPNGVNDLPVTVPTAEIDPYLDANRDRVDFYFGKSGAIIVRYAGHE